MIMWFKDIFWICWVYWISLKSWLRKLWFRYFHKSSIFINQFEKWGNSAPDLSEAPSVLSRPLESRIVRAFGMCIDNPECVDFTYILKGIISNPKNNQAQRADIFVSRLLECHPNLQKLFVTYKQGMREFHVCYKDMIVFPPSVTTPNTVSLIPSDSYFSLLYESTFFDISILMREFGGPAKDFYQGSDYETTLLDVYQFFGANQNSHISHIDKGEIHKSSSSDTIVFKISDHFINTMFCN